MNILQALSAELGTRHRTLFFCLLDDCLEITWESDDTVWAISGSPPQHTIRIRLDGDMLFLSDPACDYNFHGRQRLDLKEPGSIDTLVRTVEDWIEDNIAEEALEQDGV